MEGDLFNFLEPDTEVEGLVSILIVVFQCKINNTVSWKWILLRAKTFDLLTFVLQVQCTGSLLMDANTRMFSQCQVWGQWDFSFLLHSLLLVNWDATSVNKQYCVLVTQNHLLKLKIEQDTKSAPPQFYKVADLQTYMEGYYERSWRT